LLLPWRLAATLWALPSNAWRVAVIVEVEVNRRTGRIWPRQWTVAHDCGLIVNPDNLRRVIEGNILHATSRALFEEVRFNQQTVTSVDWLSYPILEIRDAPEKIDIVLIDHPDELPLGAGEPSTRPVAAAIGTRTTFLGAAVLVVVATALVLLSSDVRTLERRPA